MDIEDIKLKEISIFMELIRCGSVRELARQKSMQPGQISKLIKAIENKLGFPVIERSSFGVKLTAHAKEVLPFFSDIYKNQELFKSNFEVAEQPVLGFSTTSFFSTHLMPNLFSNLEKKYPKYKLRLLDLPPDLFLSAAMRGAFQVCLHMNELDWPKTWSSRKIGYLNWVLCCRKGHPVLNSPTLKSISKYPFVFPVYWMREGLSYGDDNFPVTASKRIRGYETSTATSAVELIRLTNQLGYVPEIVARRLIESGEIKNIEVPSLNDIRKPVFLSVRSDAVTQKMYDWLIERCAAEISKR